jgi:hypothetical protein
MVAPKTESRGLPKTEHEDPYMEEQLTGKKPAEE